jgi:hypothetical protein
MRKFRITSKTTRARSAAAFQHILKGQDKKSEYMQGLEEASKQREKEKFMQQF